MIRRQREKQIVRVIKFYDKKYISNKEKKKKNEEKINKKFISRTYEYYM